MKPDNILTKKKFMYGLRCLKYLWGISKDSNPSLESNIIAQHRIREGRLVRELVQQLYPGGVNVATESFMDCVEQTRVFVKQHKLLYEAGVLVDNIYSNINILKPVDDDSWDIIDIKNSTSIKPEYIVEVSFQRFCCQKAGLNIRKCFIVYLNNEYVKQGDIDIKQLFKIDDIADNVNERIVDLPKEIEKMIEVVNADKCPDVAIGQHCKKPNECSLKDDCWAFLPISSVFELSRGGKKIVQLFEQGIYAIKDIPDEFKLTDKQLVQKKCALTNSVYISKENIRDFLDTLQYPVYYLDFESFQTAIPVFNGTRPYQQIPFQFSVHVAKDVNSGLEHHSFLADGVSDPREELLTSLVNILGNKGSVVVYHQTFEKTILKELAETFPKHKKWIDKTLDRIVDLRAPFEKFYYYNPKQKNSTSIKEVLPMITGKSYKGMEISGGQVASISYLNITFEKVSNEQKEKTRKELEEYCGLDTEGMVWIVEKLEELIVE